MVLALVLLFAAAVVVALWKWSKKFEKSHRWYSEPIQAADRPSEAPPPLISVRVSYGRPGQQVITSAQVTERAGNGLAPPNVPANWRDTPSWKKWRSPLNIVKGESKYQTTFEGLFGKPKREGYFVPVITRLRREPQNPYDVNAIRVEVDGQLLGYIAAPIAKVVAPELDAIRCPEMNVAGIVRGGSLSAPNFGLHLWLDKRLCPGIVIRLKGVDFLKVPWPPYEGEGE